MGVRVQQKLSYLPRLIDLMSSQLRLLIKQKDWGELKVVD